MPRLPSAVLDRLPQRFARFERQAEDVARDEAEVRSLVRRSAQKLRRHRRQLGQLTLTLPMLLRLARAWAVGDYRRVPWKALVLVVAALLYFINPLDLIPDYLPVVGYVDDAAVVAFVLRSIQDEVRKFEKWERSNRRRR